MKQRRFTSADFVPEGETGHDDAVMDPADLADIKRLAGIPVTEDFYQAGGSDPAIHMPNDTDTGHVSPVGSNISVTGQEKRDLERKHDIKPGTDEWFKLWFSRPYLTGEKPIGDAPAPKIPKNKKSS